MTAHETFFHLYRQAPEPEESGTVELSTSLAEVRAELEEIARGFEASDPGSPRRRQTRLYDATYHALTRFEPEGPEGDDAFVARTFVVPDRWLAAGGYDMDAAFEVLPWEILTPPHLEALDPDERHALPELPVAGLTLGHRKVDERLGALEESLALTGAYLVDHVRNVEATLGQLSSKIARLEESSKAEYGSRAGAWWRNGRILVLVGTILALLIAGLAWVLWAATDAPAGPDLPLDQRTVGRVLETAATHEDPTVRDRAAALYLDLVLDEVRTLTARERDALVQQVVGDTPDGAFGSASRQLLESYLDRSARCCSDLLGISRRTCALNESLGLAPDVVCSGRFPFDGDLTWSAEAATALLLLSRQARALAPSSMARRLEELDLTTSPARATRLPTVVVDPGEAERLGELAATISWGETDSADRVE